MEEWNKPEIIDECLGQIEEIVTPFHDVFRSIYGFNKMIPSMHELKQTHALISYLVLNKKVLVIFGPEMQPSAYSNKDDLKRIGKIILIEEYEKYSYGIWLDLASNWKDKAGTIEEFLKTAQQNLIIIRNSNSESLHIKDFEMDKNSRIDSGEMIRFLVDLDYLENEKDENVFYLSSDTYDLIDEDRIEDELYMDAIGYSAFSGLFYNEDNNDTHADEDLFMPVDERNGPNYNTGWIALFIFILIRILFWLGPQNDKKEERFNKIIIEDVGAYLKQMQDSLIRIDSVKQFPGPNFKNAD